MTIAGTRKASKMDDMNMVYLQGAAHFYTDDKNFWMHSANQREIKDIGF